VFQECEEFLSVVAYKRNILLKVPRENNLLSLFDTFVKVNQKSGCFDYTLITNLMH